MSEVQLPAQTKSKIDYDLLPYETDGIKISHRCVLCKAWASSARVDALEVDLQKIWKQTSANLIFTGWLNIG